MLAPALACLWLLAETRAQVTKPPEPWTIVASVRLGGLLAGGRDVIQPVGFGAGLDARVHGWAIGPLYVGGVLRLGHTRFLEQRNVSYEQNGAAKSARRYAALGHTDFTVGPSLAFKVGRVLVGPDVSVGLGISTFGRPTGGLSVDEETYSDVSFLLRGGGFVQINVRGPHCVVLGMTANRFFSRKQIPREPASSPEDPPLPLDTNPFDLMLEGSVGYGFRF